MRDSSPPPLPDRRVMSGYSQRSFENTYTLKHTHARTHARTHTHAHTLMHTHTRTHTHTHTHMHTRMCVCVRVRSRVRVRVQRVAVRCVACARLLPSSPHRPVPLFTLPFFCSHSNYDAITRLVLFLTHTYVQVLCATFTSKIYAGDIVEEVSL